MKRVYVCIFILMAVVAVSFFSLCRVKTNVGEVESSLKSVLSDYRKSGVMPASDVNTLVNKWKDTSKSIAYSENKNELDEITRLFAQLETAKDLNEFESSAAVIEVSLFALVFNESPSGYTVA